MSSNPSQFVRDFREPRSARQSVYTPSLQGPIGTIVHCLLNRPIYCDEKDHEKNSKGLRSMTILSIVKEGWCYAPWKKPKGKDKTARSPDAKQLFEINGGIAEHNGNRAVRSLKVFAFEREGKMDKGMRNDEMNSVIEVGMTLRFKIHDFMYEKKSSNGRENVFPSDLEVIPEMSLVEAMLLPGTTDSSSKGFGLSLASIRPLQHSLYSYLHPLGLALLPSTFDEATDLARQLAEKGAPIQAMIETGCVSFVAKVNKKAHLTPIAPGMYRLSAGEDAAVESVHELDVREEDLLRYTNAGDDLGYALFLCDMAAAAGALLVFVVRDPYFQKKDASYGEYRAIPLVDSEKLLSFVDTSVSTGDDDEVQYDLPFDIETLEQPQAIVSTSGVPTPGIAPACPDFVLHSEAVQSAKAYTITIGDSQQESIMKILYSIPESNSKRAAAGERVDYRSLKTMKTSV